MQVNARWPNAFWHDFSVFNVSYWATSSKDSTYVQYKGTGVMVDDGDKDLAGSGLNATGAIALLNIGSWFTYAGTVENHAPGESSFTFDIHQNPGKISFNPIKNRYYLEDKLEFLDAPTEWFYDKDTKKLYLWPDDGKNPSDRNIRGKVMSYSLNITSGSSCLVFSGIQFFATTLSASGEKQGEDIHDIRFESLQFTYPTYSKRMLGSLKPPDTTYVYHNGDLNEPTNFTFFNCTFEYADGLNMLYRGSDGVFENNLWHHNDFSCVEPLGIGEPCGSVCSKGIRDWFVRNTVHSNGAGVGYKPGGNSNNSEVTGSYVHLNHFYDMKYLQHDGAHIQATVPAQNGTVLSHNWAYNTMKFGFRFDRTTDLNASWGYNCTMIANIAWNTNGMMVKGDYHRVENCLSFDNQNGEAESAVDLIVLGTPGQGMAGENEHSLVSNNYLQKGSSASRTGGFPITAKQSDNVDDVSVRTELRDPDNFDFRPVAGSKLYSLGVGPYGTESSNDGGTYWIPGRQLMSSSIPIPPNGTITAKCTAHLMWLAGYNATSHQVYFGTDVQAVANADTSSNEFKVDMKMPANILDPGTLKPHLTYAWRVDAVQLHSDQIQGIIDKVVIKGDVWTFKCQ